MRRHILIAFLLTILFLISLFPGTVLSEEGTTLDGIPEIESSGNNRWLSWNRDGNHNGIDDVLDDMIVSIPESERTKIFIDYSRSPTDEDIASLSKFDLKIDYVYHIVDTICARDVLISDIKELSLLPGVVMIEYEDDISGFLDISARAIKARGSVDYSVNTVHDMGILGRNIPIAILDTGVDDDLTRSLMQHHDSVDDLDDDPDTDDPKFLAGADVRPGVTINVNPDDEVFPGHGTHVTGIAMGTGAPLDNDEDSEFDYIGVAPQARLVDVKVIRDYRSGTGGELLAGIQWCADNKDQYGIRIMSMSLGGSYNSNGSDAISQAVNEAVDGGLIAVVAIVGALLFLPGTQEDEIVKERYFSGEYERMNFFRGIWEVIKLRSFIIFFIALNVFSIATSMLMANAPFINTFLLQASPGDEFIIFVIFILGAFISVPFWIRYLRKVQNNKKVLTIGGILLSVTLFPLTFFQTTIDLYIMLFILGLAMGSMWCFFYTIIQASVVDDFVATTKKNQKGILLGVSILLGRLVATVDEGICALVHTLTGFPAGEETYAGLVAAVTAAGGDLNLVLFGIRLLFGIIPCVILLAGTFVFWKYFPLTQDKVLENKKILEELGF